MRINIKNLLKFAMLGLLVLSFAMWGVSDYLFSIRSTDGNVLATVGDKEISYNDLSIETSLTMGDIASEILNNEDFRKLILQAKIDKTLTALEAQSIRISPAKTDIAQWIQKNEKFTANGTFDILKFRTYLGNLGVTETAFLDMSKESIQNEIMFRDFHANLVSPQLLAKLHYFWQEEKRAVKIIEFPLPSFESLAPPSEENLKTHYADNPESFRAPEYRSFKLLTIAPANFTNDVIINNDELETLYDENKENFIEESRWKLLRLVFKDELSAQQEYERLLSLSEQEVSETFAKAHDFGWQTLSSLYSEENLRNSIANLQQKQFTKPIPLTINWGLFYAAEFNSEKEMTKNEALKLIKQEIVLEKSNEKSYEAYIQATDALVSKTDIDTIATELGLTIQNIEPLSAGGFTQDNVRHEKETLAPEILQEVFSLRKDEVSQALDNGQNGFFVVQVTDVIESQLRDFSQIKPLVKVSLEQQMRIENARKTADNFASLYTDVSQWPNFTKGKNLTIQTIDDLGRSRLGSTEHADVHNQIKDLVFSIKVGEAKSLIKDNKVFLIGVTDSKTVQDEQKSLATFDTLSSQLLIEQFTDHLQSKYPISINSNSTQPDYY